MWCNTIQRTRRYNNIPPIFDDDDFLEVSYLDEEDQIQHDLVIETESHEILNPDQISIPNQKPNPIWAQKLIDVAGNGAENP